MGYIDSDPPTPSGSDCSSSSTSARRAVLSPQTPKAAILLFGRVQSLVSKTNRISSIRSSGNPALHNSLAYTHSFIKSNTAMPTLPTPSSSSLVGIGVQCNPTAPMGTFTSLPTSPDNNNGKNTIEFISGLILGPAGFIIGLVSLVLMWKQYQVQQRQAARSLRKVGFSFEKSEKGFQAWVHGV